MTLELNRIAQQVEDMGRVLAARAEQRRKALPALRALRELYSNDLDRLRNLAESPAGQEAKCALPTHEVLDEAISEPVPPAQAMILASDGSQIYPDLHGWAPYYLINVGSLVYRHGSGKAPDAESVAKVAQAIDAEGDLLTGEWINARRDVAEMQKLAELAEAEQVNGPLVALLDSTLGLRVRSEAIPQTEQEALLQSYDVQLERIRMSGAALAGVISRSRRASVVSLLDLAQMEGAGSTRTGPSPFVGITDQLLWGDLQPGERSALFVEVGARPVYFFYLNTEPSEGPHITGVEAEPARIEVPEWVALSSSKLSWVHALVYDQCCINNGYPYALSRADELAIILNEERDALETMLLQAMNRQGLPLPRLSLKAVQKRIARAPFRRRL